MEENVKPKMSKRAKRVFLGAILCLVLLVICSLINTKMASINQQRLEHAKSLIQRSQLEEATAIMVYVAESPESTMLKLSENLCIFFFLATVILFIVGLVLRSRDSKSKKPAR